MKRILLTSAVVAFTAAPGFAQDTRSSSWTMGDGARSALSDQSVSAEVNAPSDDVRLSVTGSSGAATAAFVRWHFAQGERGEGASRFAEN